MILQTQIQDRLSEAIRLSGLSQTKLAQQLGVSQQQISCYLNKQKMPALDTFANLCKLLDVDTNYILCQYENDLK